MSCGTRENGVPEENRLLEDTESSEATEKRFSPSNYEEDVSFPATFWRFTTIVSLFFLFFSLSANVFQYWQSGQKRFIDGSSLTGVRGGVSRTFYMNSEWSSDNKSHTDMLWEDLNFETSIMVVMDKEESKKLNLYETDTFPFDENMNLYDLEGFHSLHCLAYLYEALRQFEQNLPQSHPMHHHIHCLDALREDIVCAADDTLRPSNSGQGGIGTPLTPGKRPLRQCRDWTQLERWSEQNSACFKRYPKDHPNYGTMEEWRNCPEGSPWIPIIEEYLDKNKTL